MTSRRGDPTLRFPEELQSPKWTSKMWCEIDDAEDDSPYMTRPLPPFTPPLKFSDDQSEALPKLDKGKEAKEKEVVDLDANNVELEQCEPLSREWFSKYGNGESNWKECEPLSKEWFSKYGDGKSNWKEYEPLSKEWFSRIGNTNVW